MPAMTNPDDYYQEAINTRHMIADNRYIGTNGLSYCAICHDPCLFMKMQRGHWHCVTCGEER